jgi:hypothetical protein
MAPNPPHPSGQPTDTLSPGPQGEGQGIESRTRRVSRNDKLRRGGPAAYCGGTASQARGKTKDLEEPQRLNGEPCATAAVHIRCDRGLHSVQVAFRAVACSAGFAF